MESKRVKELREKYGIMDSRNKYTEEEIIELSKRKLYYISHYGDDITGNIHIQYKQVPGYVSNDEKSSIWVKDKDITGQDEKYYYPIKSLRNCAEIKKGIYHDKVDDIIYCTTDELDFCLEYEREHVKNKIQDEIKELEKQILQLKYAKIEFNQIK